MNAHTRFRDAHSRDLVAPADRRMGPATHLALGVGLAGAAVALAFLAAREPKQDHYDIDWNAEHAELVEGLPPVQPAHEQPKPWLQMLWPPVFMALALSGLRVWNAPASPARTRALTLWSLLQGFNAAWMTLGSRRLGGQLTAGAAALGASVAYALNARRVEQPVTGLASPYIGWMGFANVVSEQLWKRRGPTVH